MKRKKLLLTLLFSGVVCFHSADLFSNPIDKKSEEIIISNEIGWPAATVILTGMGLVAGLFATYLTNLQSSKKKEKKTSSCYAEIDKRLDLLKQEVDSLKESVEDNKRMIERIIDFVNQSIAELRKVLMDFLMSKK